MSYAVIFATTSVAAGDLFETVPSARMDVALMHADPSYKPQAVTVEALRGRGLIDRGDRPHNATLKALAYLAGMP